MTMPMTAAPTKANGTHQLIASALPYDVSAFDNDRHVLSPEMVGEVAPVGDVEEHEVGLETGLDPSCAVAAAKDVRGVDRAGRERLGRRHPHLRAREAHDDWEALAEGAARIEVGSQRDDRTRVNEVARRRHRATEEESRRREQHGRDVARPQDPNSFRPGRLQMVDAPGTEADCELDPARLRELVGVEAEDQAGLRAGGEIATRLHRVEGAA